MTSAIDSTKPTTGTALTSDVRANFATAASEISALQTADIFTQSGTGAVATDLQTRGRQVVYVTDFAANGVSGAKVDPTGVVDSTLGIQAAVTAASAKRLYFPAGTYKITDTILVSLDRTNLLGDGQQATIIKFAPTTTGKAAIHFQKAASGILVQTSIKGFAFDASGNTQGTKSAIRVTDGEEIIIDDIAVSNWSSSGKDCIGFQFKGRQTHSVSNIVINADVPISIEDNPNSTIDIDHYHFQNCYFLADATQPCVKIATGINLNNVTFDGYQAWVGGSDGLKWIDTTTAQASQQLSIKNVRWEQSVNATGQMIDIEHNYGLQGLRVENCFGGLNTLGIKLRKVLNPTISNSALLNTSGNGLDADSTAQPLILDNVFFQSGSTLSVGTLKKVFGTGRSTGSSTESYQIYALPATITASKMDVPIMGSAVSIAQDAASVIGVAADQTGFLFITTDEDVGAIYFLKGATNGTAEISDWAAFFTVTKDSASSYNIYYEAPYYKIQNKRTGSHTVQWFLIGDSI